MIKYNRIIYILKKIAYLIVKSRYNILNKIRKVTKIYKNMMLQRGINEL